LAALQRGEVFAYLDNLLIIGDYQAKLKVANIKIAGQTPYVNAQRMAVRKDWAPLAGILDKALASIPETERHDIYRKWVPIRYEHGFDYALFWKVLAGFAVILLALVVWNWRLTKEIQQRKRAEAALSESEQRSRILAEASFEGIAVTAQGVLLDCSEHMARMLGYGRSELLGKSVQEFIAPEHRDRVAEAQRTGRLELYEHRMLRADGTEFPVEVRARSAQIGGRPVRITAVRDMTEHQRSEQALRLFQYSIDQASDAVFWMNREGGFSYVNDQACRSLGYSRDELLQLCLWDIDPVFPKALWFERWEAYQKDRRGGAEHLESSHRRKDGSLFPVEVVSKHLWLGDAEVHVAFVRDITERKNAEEALREKTEELNRFFTTTLDLLCVADTDGRFRRLNPQWETVLGYSLAELDGKRFLDLVHPEDLEATVKAVARLDAQQPVLNFVNRYCCKDGSYRWFEWRSSPRGKLIYAAARDITERKRTEETLLRVNKAVECASDAIGLADSQGRHFYQNKAFTDLFEYKTEEINAPGGEPAGYVNKNLAREVFAKIMSGGAWSGEVEMKSKSGRKFPVWMRADAIKDEDGRVIGLVGVHTDITERQRAAEALRYRADFERVLLHISAQLMAVIPAEVDAAVNQALADVGRFAGVDRCYAFLFRDQNTFADNTHEWCADGIEPQLPRLQGLAVTDFPSLAGTIAHGQPVCISRVRDLPPESAERQELEREGIQSLVLVPMVFGDAVLGFLGVDSVRTERIWGDDLVDLLKITGNMIANALERKRAEEALRASMTQLQTVVTGAPIVLYSFDRHGVFTVSEGKGLAGLGLKPGEIVGRSVFDVYGNLPEAIAALRRALAGETFTLELSFPAGGTFEVSHIAMRDAAGNYDGTIGVLVDITERKRAEAVAREGQERLGLALKGADLGSWDWNVQTGEVRVNERWAQMLGCRADEIEPHVKTWEDLVHPEDLPRVREVLQAHLDGRTPSYETEHRMRHKSGGWVWVLDRGRVITRDAAGKPLRATGTHLDITERKLAELKLRESEALYHDLVETSQDLIWQCDAEGLYTYLNPAWEEVFGCRLEEMLGRSFADFQSPEHAARDVQVFAQLLQGGSVRGHETVHRAKDGRALHLVFNAKAIMDGSGRILGTRGTAYDITERKRAETALQESETRFRQVVESSPMPLGISNLSGQIEYINPRFQEVFGYSLEEVSEVKHWFQQAYPDPDYRQTVAAQWQQAIEKSAQEQRHSEVMDVHITCRDGSVRIMQVFGAIMGDRLLAVFNDLTERIRTEEALRESEQRFAVFMENLPAGAFMKDVPGAVVYANRYLCDLFGWENVVGQSTRDLMPPEVAERMEAEDRAALAHGPLTVTEQVRDAAHRERIFQTSKFPIARAGRAPLLGGITVDITELRRIEQRLQAALEEKTTLLREVHHRVKNNLQAMIALMRMRDRQLTDPAARQLLAQLQEQVRTMSLVYEQLYQSGNLAQVKMPDYLGALAMHGVRAFGGDREVDLRIEVEDLVLDVADASPCGLIVNELLTNALKHAFPPEFASQSVLRVGLRRLGKRLELTVEDNGRGLPPGLDWEHAQSLGLRLVHMWATHQMGATIQVDNTPGARYTITFEPSVTQR
jgi:PAS domain S-box-containing protein